jgi:hypothetical protein
VRREVDNMRLRLDYMFYKVVEFWRSLDQDEDKGSEGTNEWKCSVKGKEREGTFSYSSSSSSRYGYGRRGKRLLSRRSDGGRGAAPVSSAARWDDEVGMELSSRKRRRMNLDE